MRSALAVVGAVLLAIAVLTTPLWIPLAGRERIALVGASFLVCVALVVWAFSDRSR
jgi:hypothetical protein